jgi:hypothetical protein
MFDEVNRLRSLLPLARLLANYAAAADRGAWQDRLMELDDLPARELVSLHGELLAYGWIEQNTGVVTGGPPGVVAQCYRVTAAGVRAGKRAQVSRPADEDSAEAA